MSLNFFFFFKRTCLYQDPPPGLLFLLYCSDTEKLNRNFILLIEHNNGLFTFGLCRNFKICCLHFFCHCIMFYITRFFPFCKKNTLTKTYKCMIIFYFITRLKKQCLALINKCKTYLDITKTCFKWRTHFSRVRNV